MEPFGVLIHLDETPEPELGYVPPPELARRWTSPTDNIVTTGHRVSAEVPALDASLRGQAALSLRARQESPWKNWSSRIGSVATGNVTANFVPYGIFIAIGDGIGGLLPHTPAMVIVPPWELAPAGQQETFPLGTELATAGRQESLPPGTELTVRVTQIEVPQRRMHLSPENIPR